MKYANNTYTLEQIAGITGGEFSGSNPGLVFENLSTDSRSGETGEKTLFVALRGKKDGHSFIPEMVKKGVRAFLVERIPEGVDANFIRVNDALAALQALAACNRNKFGGELIAITGSNGKTIVKEWLNELLDGKYKTIRSPKSFNSRIGVPLSVMQLSPAQELALIEAGISMPGEMAVLEHILHPNVGILTHIGPAHDENFTSREQKLREKLILFSGCRTLITAEDDRMIGEFCREKGIELIKIGRAEGDYICIFQVEPFRNHTEIRCLIGGKEERISVPFIDTASVENALLAAAAAHYLGVPVSEIKRRINRLNPVEMRLEIKEGENNCTLISDVYNSDLQSIRVALELLHRLDNHPDLSVVISDVLQSGLKDEELYRQLAAMLSERKYKHLVCVGQTISRYKEFFPPQTIFCRSTHALVTMLPGLNFSGESILLKGASAFRFEDVAALLSRRVHDTVFEVNLSAMANNLNVYRSHLKPSTKMMCMVKARSYGFGGFEIADMLQFHGVDYLGVAYADEGVSLRENGVSLPIIVMNPEQSSYRTLIRHRLEPEIYSARVLDRFVWELDNSHAEQPYPIHIKLETGMNRLGFSEKEIPELVSKLKDYPQVRVISVFSHLATADDDDEREFTLSQIARFDGMFAQLSGGIGYRPMRHILNSNGIVKFPEHQYEMVRLGLGLYGLSPIPEIQQQLQVCGVLRTVISQIKTIGKGESVSYNRRFIAGKGTKVATLPIGYADGIRRLLGNGVGSVQVGGKRAPILGTVCMDTMMVDVTGIDCREGDSVVVIGDSPSAWEIADLMGTIPYEVFTSIAERVKRIYIQE